MVTALGKTYHQSCFACANCSKTFAYGEKVIYTKNQCVCTGCIELDNNLTKTTPVKQSKDEIAKKEKKIKKDKNNNQTKSLPLLDKKNGLKKNDLSKEKEIKNSLINSSKNDKSNKLTNNVNQSICAGCNKSLNKPVSILHDSHQPRSTSRQSGRSVQIQDRPNSVAPTENTTLFALNRHWHENCFRCTSCETPLFNKEYMTSKLDKDNEDSQNKLIDSLEHQMAAHCMTCYKAKLSVRCSYCNRIIEGKVLQAGNDLHFHPTCCRCFKCGFLFTHAQEMYVQGKAIWHAHCEGLRYEQLESHVSLNKLTKSEQIVQNLLCESN